MYDMDDGELWRLNPKPPPGSPVSVLANSAEPCSPSTLLQREGPHLSEPYTRQLRAKLRELRFYIGRERVRIS
jgi:hypothetical protein